MPITSPPFTSPGELAPTKVARRFWTMMLFLLLMLIPTPLSSAVEPTPMIDLLELTLI